MIMVIIYIFVAFILIFLIYNSKLNEKIIEGNDGIDETKDCLGVYDINGYGECDKPCGGGVQRIPFNITQPPLDGYFQGNNEEANQCPEPKERPCNTHNCPIHCEYVGGGEGWGAWIKNLDSNGKQIGTETRTRKILVNEEYNGTPCGKVTETRNHDVDCEYVRGGDGWGVWIKNLDNNGKQIGTETRTREILVNEINNGTQCGKVTETRKHDVDCVQSTWSNWGACSTSCGGGEQRRTRSILQYPKNSGNKCEASEQTQSCNTQPCPIDCVLSDWKYRSYWGCSGDCGGRPGTRRQSKDILKNQQHGGKECEARYRNVSCTTKACNISDGIHNFKGGRSGKYCADESHRVVCNRDKVGSWEKFTMTRHGDKYVLKGGKDGKYCADEGHRVVCNRTAIGAWEKFTIVKHGNKYALKGGKDGKYCADESEGIKCNRDKVYGWEMFTIG